MVFIHFSLIFICSSMVATFFMNVFIDFLWSAPLFCHCVHRFFIGFHWVFHGARVHVLPVFLLQELIIVVCLVVFIDWNILVKKVAFVAIVAPFFPVVVCDGTATVLVNDVAVLLSLNEPAAGWSTIKKAGGGRLGEGAAPPPAMRSILLIVVCLRLLLLLSFFWNNEKAGKTEKRRSRTSRKSWIQKESQNCPKKWVSKLTKFSCFLAKTTFSWFSAFWPMLLTFARSSEVFQKLSLIIHMVLICPNRHSDLTPGFDIRIPNLSALPPKMEIYTPTLPGSRGLASSARSSK